MPEPSSDQYVVGIDFGTLTARAVVVRVADGAEIGTAVHAYRHAVIDRQLPISGEPLPPDWALQDPQDYVESMGAAVRGAIADAGIDVGPGRRHRHGLHGVHDGAHAGRRNTVE